MRRDPRTPLIRRAVIPAAVIAAVVLAGCSGSDTTGADTAGGGRPTSTTARPTTTAPAPLTRDGAGWAVPDPLPPAPAGRIIATTPPRPDPTFGGATRTELLYHSVDHAGKDVAVSGTLLVPPGTPPSGGWPVVSWAHGTTGVADVCAPSTTPNLFYNEYAQEVRSLLDAGYAVVATDYMGLGTPGGHTYLVGDDLGHATADAVTAARSLEPTLGPTWFAVGHSEGGEAALWATRAPRSDPEAHLAGAVAIAPGSGLQAALPAVMSGGAPADLVYATYILAGLAQVDPTISVDDLLGPVGKAHRDLLMDKGCLLDAATALAGTAPSDVLALDVQQSMALSERMAELGNPENAKVEGPVLVLQGEADRDVPAGLTATMVDKLVALGSDVQYRAYPGLDHDQVLGPSMCDLLAWLAARGGRPVQACTPQPTDLS